MQQTTRMMMVAGLLAFTAAPVACSGGADSSANVEKANKAADLAKKIKANPDGLDQVLKDAGMTPEQYEALLREVAADPAQSEAYAHAMGK